MKFSKTI